MHKKSHEGRGLEVSAGGIVLAKVDGETYVALVQREDGGWVLPKGHQEPRDKDLRETAVREVSEELGLNRSSLQVEQELDEYSEEIGGAYSARKVNHFFVMHYHDGTLPPIMPDIDHRDARWWKIAETLPRMHYGDQRILLGEAIEQMFAYVVRFHE